MVIFDGNISTLMIKELMVKCALENIPTWFEPTSCDKAIRVVQSSTLPLLTYMSPSLDELYAISNEIAPHSDDPHEFNLQCIEHHVRKGKNSIHPGRPIDVWFLVLEAMIQESCEGSTTKHIIVTLGHRGVAHGSTSKEKISFSHYLGSPMPSTTNCTGAGDTLVAGTVYGVLGGNDVAKSLQMGMAAARKSLLAPEAIHPELSSQDLNLLISI